MGVIVVFTQVWDEDDGERVAKWRRVLQNIIVCEVCLGSGLDLLQVKSVGDDRGNAAGLEWDVVGLEWRMSLRLEWKRDWRGFARGCFLGSLFVILVSMQVDSKKWGRKIVVRWRYESGDESQDRFWLIRVWVVCWWKWVWSGFRDRV